MNVDKDFTLEKLKLREDVTSLMTEVRISNENYKLTNEKIEKNITRLTEIITGNGHPEQGLAFRIVQIESKEDGKKQNSTALWTFISSLGVLVVADFIHRAFFSHTKG